MFAGTLTVSNSTAFRSFLLSMCMEGPESRTKFLSFGCIVDSAGRHHTSEGEKNVALFRFSLSQYTLLAKFQASPRAHLDKSARSLREMGFLSRLMADCNASDMNYTRRLGLNEVVPFRRFDLNFSGSASKNTHPQFFAIRTMVTLPFAPPFFDLFD